GDVRQGVGQVDGAAGDDVDDATAGVIGEVQGGAQRAAAVVVGGAIDQVELHLEGADVRGAVDNAVEAALVGGQRDAGGGGVGLENGAPVDGGTVGQEGHGRDDHLGARGAGERAAVVLQGAEQGVGVLLVAEELIEVAGGVAAEVVALRVECAWGDAPEGPE